MTLQGIKFILIIGIICLLTLFGFVIWNESFYFDMVPFLSPVEFASDLPIRNDSRGSGEFGTRRNGNRSHQGIDILAPTGTKVRAAKGGIAFAAENKKGMGKFVKIRHKNGLSTIYGHLSKVYIQPIQRVRQGEFIGEVGKTGNARYPDIQPHVHFEVRMHGVAKNPREYLYK